MSTNHRGQVMPPLSPDEYAVLKASIDANGVWTPIEVDEEGNIIDGFHRKQICDELRIECPERVLAGLTEAQKLEQAWQANVARRHLSKAQKRQLAEKLWHDGQTQERIAQLLGVSQPTIANWVPEFINSDKFSPSSTVEGKDGKQYPRTKRRRYTAQPAEGSSLSDNPLRSDADARPAQAREQGETPPPQGTHPETQLSGTEPPAASDASGESEASDAVVYEFQATAREQASSPMGSSSVPLVEDDAEAHWVGALEDLALRLETLQVQGGLLPLSTRWAPETRARGMAKIRHMKEICIALEAVVGAEMCETADWNGHNDVTPSFVPPPLGNAAQDNGNHELSTVSSAQEPGEDVAAGDQFPLQYDGEGQPPAAPSRPARAEDRKDAPARTRTQRSKRAVANAQGSGAPEQMAQDHTTPDNSRSRGETATLGHPAPHHHEEAVEPAADATRPIGVSAPADDGDSALVDLTRCGWCGDTQFSFMSQETGQIYCTCGSIYRPSSGVWDPGDRDKWHNPPVSVPATECAMQDETEPGSGEATASSPAGAGAFGSTAESHQPPPAGPHDTGETHPRECR